MPKKLILMIVAFLVFGGTVTTFGFSAWTYINRQSEDVDFISYDVIDIEGVSVQVTKVLEPGVIFFYNENDKTKGTLTYEITVNHNIFSGTNLSFSLTLSDGEFESNMIDSILIDNNELSSSSYEIDQDEGIIFNINVEEKNTFTVTYVFTNKIISNEQYNNAGIDLTDNTFKLIIYQEVE